MVRRLSIYGNLLLRRFSIDTEKKRKHKPRVADERVHGGERHEFSTNAPPGRRRQPPRILIPILSRLGRQDAALCAPVQCNRSLTRNGTLYHCTIGGTVRRVGGEHRSRLSPRPHSSFGKAAPGFGPTGAASKCQKINGARNSIRHGWDQPVQRVNRLIALAPMVMNSTSPALLRCTRSHAGWKA